MELVVSSAASFVPVGESLVCPTDCREQWNFQCTFFVIAAQLTITPLGKLLLPFKVAPFWSNFEWKKLLQVRGLPFSEPTRGSTPASSSISSPPCSGRRALCWHQLESSIFFPLSFLRVKREKCSLQSSSRIRQNRQGNPGLYFK